MYCFCLRDDAQQDEEQKTTTEHKTAVPIAREKRSLASLGTNVVDND